MRGFSVRIRLLFAVAAALPSQTFTTLASFAEPNPGAPLVQGVNGGFYGTVLGGLANLGAV